ncbi:MAG: 6-pyruvoyl trahydropterin synthase family protein [Egibacteraceae bacterium]
MYSISKRFAFCASHTLDRLPAEHPCARLHGHNYEVQLVLASPELDDAGFVVDYRLLDPFKSYLDSCLDHRHLNDVIGAQPSAERLARWLFDWCTKNLEASIVSRLVAVRVSETPKTWAEYRP